VSTQRKQARRNATSSNSDGHSYNSQRGEIHRHVRHNILLNNEDRHHRMNPKWEHQELQQHNRNIFIENLLYERHQHHQELHGDRQAQHDQVLPPRRPHREDPHVERNERRHHEDNHCHQDDVVEEAPRQIIAKSAEQGMMMMMCGSPNTLMNVAIDVKNMNLRHTMNDKATNPFAFSSTLKLFPRH